jgi:DNA-binding LytR/AlgR family response regulator
MKISCLIVDDEPIARDILESHVKLIPELTLVKSCKNTAEAHQILSTSDIHLMFLDIQMPGITGIEFLRSLENPPLAVFTTAYTIYAVEGFELNSVDYLLKPITFERFYQAYIKVRDRVALHQDNNTRDAIDYIFIKQDYKLLRINYQDIDYIQAEGDFCAIFIGDKRLLASQPLRVFESQLSQTYFCRSHRSYIVNLKKIQAIKGNSLEVGKKEIPIGANFRDVLLRKLSVF